MKPHQRSLQAKVDNWNESKGIKPTSRDVHRSLVMKVIWTLDSLFPTIFNKTCTCITFKSAMKHRDTATLVDNLSAQHMRQNCQFIYEDKSYNFCHLL